MPYASANPSQIPRTFMMTYTLIAINIAIFAFVELQGGASYGNLLRFGAKENGLIAEGQIWRLFAPMFLHANLLHIGFNMYGLFHVGRYLELISGPRLLLMTYLVAGLTGNLCSFAFSSQLSVGASGSLFGILLCIYVFHKYEEKLAIEANETPRKTTLGTLIVVNFIISFIIPNIDWASHLGGALAGVLLGMSIVMRHRWQLRSMRAVRYLGMGSGLLKPKIIERESFYYLALALLNIAFASSVARVGLAQRAFGRGVLAASENSSEKRDTENVSRFTRILASPKSETQPDHMLRGAIVLHRQSHHHAAAQVYDVLLIMHRAGLGDPEFLSDSTRQLLEVSLDAALKGRPLPEGLAETLPDIPEPPTTDLAAICEKPASLFKTLGFFELAGKLYECASIVSPGDVARASEAVECYWLFDQHETARFLSTLEEGGPPRKTIPRRTRRLQREQPAGEPI